MRQRDTLVSPSRSLMPSPPLKWPQHAGGMLHPAVFPSFRTPESVSSATAVDLPPGAYAMIIHKPSLFLLGFGLMLLGVCFFSSGFFLGMWIGGKSASPAHVIAGEGGSSGGASASRTGTFLGLAGTAVGGKAGRLAFAGQRAANKEARQHARAEGSSHPASGQVTSHETQGGPPEEAATQEAEGVGEGGDGGAPASSTTYAIQLGSFATKENAQDLVGRLKDAHFSVYLVESKDTDGGPLFCVRSGNFARFVLAETAVGNFSEQGISAIVVAVKPTDKRLVH